MVKERISTRTIEETQNADQPQKNNLGGTSLAAYQKSLETIFAETNSTNEGLNEQTVENRQAENGFNELKTKERDSILKLFLETFRDAMVLVLLAVAAIQIVMGHAAESLIILAVLMINAGVSVVQTRKAEGSLEALKSLSAPMAKVKRAGDSLTIPAREVVVGDIVSLTAGDYVPADGRLIEAGSLKVDESMLTGESLPADKQVKNINGAVPIGDRFNMVHSGTLTVYGRGEFVVTGIANDTEIGKVANLLDNALSKQTPLQKSLEHFSKKLGVGILALSALIFGIQFIRMTGEGTADMGAGVLNAFMFAVAVAVAAIPEALQSIVTIVLSIGTKKMAK